MRRTSVGVSQKERSIENKKGEEGVPVRAYVRVILNPENVKYIVFSKENLNEKDIKVYLIL